MSLLDKIDKKRTPQHIAIIMDGNGRWAKSRGLERFEGHKKGVEAVRRVVEAAANTGVVCLTLYAFSTENWRRPDDEVSSLMNLMVHAISQETPELIKNGIRLQSIGDTDRLPEETRQALINCIDATSDGKNLTLVIALSYSSRWELTEATKKIAQEVKNGTMDENDITEETIDKCLTTKSLPELDLLIRTGGEERISNFLLWQAAYAELYFTDVFWPDFGAEELYKAVLDFQNRERRFGKTTEQLETGNNNILDIKN